MGSLRPWIKPETFKLIVRKIKMKDYVALFLVIVLSVGLAKSQRSEEDEKRAQGIIKKFCENPTANKSDLKTTLENEFGVNCDAPGRTRPIISSSTGLKRRQKRAGPIC